MPGRDGIHIPEFGLAARSCLGAEVLASAGTAASDGVGIIGDSIGAAGTRCTAAAGTTPAAIRFITGAITTGRGARVAAMASEAGPDPALMQATDLPARTPKGAAERTTARALPPGLSTEIRRLLGDTRHLGARAARGRALSTATEKADRPKATHRAAALAWAEECVAVVVAECMVVAEAVAMAVAGTGNRSSC